MERLILIDGHSVIYRSYYAFIRNPLRDLKGRNTSAIFGFVNTLKKIEKEFEPLYIGVVFDTGKPTFRDEKFAEYKTQRPPASEDLKWQVPIIKDIAKKWGIQIIEMEGFEADDVLASIAKKLASSDFHAIIVSSDKDLMQIVNDKISTYDSYREILYTPAKVEEKFGVPPPKIVDILALEGDAIDNVPGIPGIGEKRAKQIILKYNSLEEACEKDELLKKHKEAALFSKGLVQLNTEIDIKIKKEDFLKKEKDFSGLIQIFRELNFTTFLKELSKKKKIEVPMISEEEFEFKTSVSLLPSNGELIAYNGEKGTRLKKGSEKYHKLCSADIKKFIYDFKEILNFTEEKLKGEIFDIKTAEWCLEPDKKVYTLDEIILYREGAYELDKEAQTPAIFSIGKQQEKMIKEKGLEHVFYKIETPLSPVLFRMEKRGVKIDIPHFKELSSNFSKYLQELEERIQTLAGIKFNVSSPKQLSEVLFQKLRLPRKKKTKTGYSTDTAVLTELVDTHPIISEILHYRMLSKIKNTYLEPLVEYADSDARIHTTFDQTGTSTGRLTTKNPNLQNVPIKGEWGKEVRKGFISQDGFLLISADYSQIELRILAHLSEDEVLRNIFLKGGDIHTDTAVQLLEKNKEAVTPEDRRLSKVINYGIIYGMSEHGLATELSISHKKASEFIEKYFSLYKGVKEWREKLIEEVKKTNQTTTIFGRIRKIPGLNSKNKNIQEAAKRACINTPIQGSAADIIKKVMIELDKEFRQRQFKGGIILQIHDELLFEIEEERIEEAKKIIKEVMETTVRLKVPLKVNIGIGKNWAEAH